MIRLSKKIKIISVILFLLIIGSGIGAYFVFLKNSPTSEAPSVKVEQDKKVDDVLSYIKTEEEFTTFSSLLAKQDMTKLQVANQEGGKPRLVLLAPTENAFEKDESKSILKLSDQLKDEITKYHIVTIPVTETNKEAELILKDGDKLKTISNQTLIIKKSGNSVSLIDGKGRSAKIQSPKVIGKDGTTLLKVDNILLFQ